MNRKKIEINLNGSRNAHDIIYRFYKALNNFYGIGEAECLRRVDKNDVLVNWDAFSDNISVFTFEQKEIDEVVLVIRGEIFIRTNLEKDTSSQNTFDTLMRVLAHRSDPSQRNDKINLLLQYQLN